MAAAMWKVWLSPPEVGEVERALLIDAFDSGWVAPAGPDLEAFEMELSELTGGAHVAALSSGSAALHLALLGVGVQPGDDVLVSTLTFGASSFAVSHAGARPCFIDCEPFSWHLDPDLLADELRRRAAVGRLPAAIVSVDLYGSVADGASIATAAAEFDVPVVEDAAEALGARRDGVPASRFGQVGVLSFNGNKIVTTGGGGAIVSGDPAVVARARYLATQARQPVPWFEHHDIGFNYRMGNLNAAVGRGQLRTLSARIDGRRRVRARYEHRLAGRNGIRFQGVPAGCEPNHWLTTISIDPGLFGASAASVVERLHSAGIEARFGFKPMHLQPVHAGCPVVRGEVAARHFETSVCLPSSARLSDDDVDWICDVIAGAAS